MCRGLGYEAAATKVAIVEAMYDLLYCYGASNAALGAVMVQADKFSQKEWNEFKLIESNVTLLCELRAKTYRMKETMQHQAVNAQDLFAAPDSSPCNLKDCLPVDSATLISHAGRLMDGVRDMWSVALSKQTVTVDNCSLSGWEAHLDELLDKPAIYEALILNAKYSELHKTNELLMSNIKLIKQITQD